MGTRSIPLNPAGSVATAHNARTQGNAQAVASNSTILTAAWSPAAHASGMVLGLLTALLAAQTGSMALSITLMLVPAPALLLFRNWKAIAGHGGVWLAIIMANLLIPGMPRALQLPLEAGHTVQHGAFTYLGVMMVYLSLLHAVSRLLQKETRDGQEATSLLEKLAPNRMLDLSQRAQSADGHKLTPAAAAFNAHADHLVRLISAFSMLRSDMKQLADIAARLRQKAAVQKERSDVGADQVSRLYDNNDKLSTRAEAIAQTARGAWDSADRILETTRQYEEDIRSVRERVQAGRDNVDRLFNQLVQVKAAITAASTLSDKICALRMPSAQSLSAGAVDAQAALAAQTQLDNLGGEIRKQFEHMESTVEELTTAIYNSTQVMTLFQEKVEMSFGMTRQITRSTQALQEENASTASAIEDLVVQMHNSQRQAMDLLSSLEFARNASQEAIAVIESSAQHIVRSESLVEEIDRELVRVKP